MFSLPKQNNEKIFLQFTLPQDVSYVEMLPTIRFLLTELKVRQLVEGLP